MSFSEFRTATITTRELVFAGGEILNVDYNREERRDEEPPAQRDT
jgi:hypothetical protein